jgi:hypothetical protein
MREVITYEADAALLHATDRSFSTPVAGGGSGGKQR